MHRVVHCGRRGPIAALASLVLFVVCVLDVPAHAAPTQVRVFGAKPNAVFEVRKNGVVVATSASSPLGSVHASTDATAGDRFDVVGPDLAPPVPPLFASLESQGAGCATASWFPSGDPTVVGYVVSFGPQSVAGGEVTRYAESVEVGVAASFTKCELATGTYFFAVQSRNAGGVMSAYSAERTITIQTLPILITSFEASVTDRGVALAWRVEADEVVEGYRVYRREGGLDARLLNSSPIEATASSFVDASTKSATEYTYQLAALKSNGDEVLSQTSTVTTPALELSLGQNYPNPFNPTTNIPLALDAAGRVVVRVFDVRGGLVATLFDGAMGEGRHSIEWNGRDERGQPVASGVYMYTLEAGKRTLAKKMVLMK